ncbi:MAG: hypothetical protein IKK92_06700 [Prevotella sp.]|nr:hypothetical protein [Prevotella sp.]
MKKFVVEFSVIKSLTDALTLFSTKDNVVSFTIGVKNPNGNNDEFLTASVSITGNNCCATKMFATKMPSDYELIEDKGAIIPYAKFSVKANKFISYANVLVSYEEDIAFTLDENRLTLDVGEKASVDLELVEDELSSSFPDEMGKSIVMIQASAASFMAFAKKACALAEKGEAITESVVIHVLEQGDNTLIRGFSTDKNCFSSDILTCEKVKLRKNFLAAHLLSEIALSLEGEVQNNYMNFLSSLAVEELPSFITYLLSKPQFDEAESEENKDGSDADVNNPFKKFQEELIGANLKTLPSVAAEHELNLDRHTFVIHVDNFQIIQKLAGTAKNITFGISANYCYVSCASTMAIFALKSDNPTWPNMMNKWNAIASNANCVVDAETLLKGLSIFSLDENANNIPVHITSNKSGLVFAKGTNKVVLPFVESDIQGKVDTYLSSKLLKKVVSNLDKGNLCFMIRDDNRVPVELHNGSLKEMSNAVAYLARVNPPNVGATKQETETKKDSETND